MPDAFDHLHPSVHPVMHQGTELRLKHLEADRWVGYPRAQEVLEQMAFMMQHAKVNQMPNLLIVADSRGGKSFLMKRFLKRHPTVHDIHLAKSIMPVLFVEMPAVPDEGKFYNEILNVFRAPYRVQDHPEKKRQQVFHYIQHSEVQLLVIDEIHNGLAGRTSTNRQLMNVIKNLSNQLQLPIVAAGTLAALRAIQTDEQIGRRFEPMALPKWANDEAWQMFIQQYERTLPLMQPSGLAEKALADELYRLSEGVIGELTKTILLAARKAIQGGKEHIDLKVLQSLNRAPPSQRKTMTEGAMKVKSATQEKG